MKMMLIDTVFSVFVNIFNTVQYFCEDEMKMLIDTAGGEDTLSSQMIASTSGKYDRAQGQQCIGGNDIKSTKVISFYWKMKLLSPRGGAKVKEFDTDHEVESRI